MDGLVVIISIYVMIISVINDNKKYNDNLYLLLTLMFSTFSKSAIHLKDELNKIMPNEPFDEEEVREMLFDAVFTQIDDDRSEERRVGKEC